MFLGNLIQRTFGEATGIAPRRASRFEPENDVLEPAIVETATEAPGPVREPVSPAPRPLETPPPPRLLEQTELIAGQAPPLEFSPPPARSAAINLAPSVEVPPPRPAPVTPPPAERLGLRRDLPPPPLPPPPHFTPAQAPPVERQTETVIRETSETRVESQTIERRLESLVREVERTEESRTMLLVPSKTESAAPPVPLASRTVIVPSASRSLPSRLVPVELPAAAPASPVVHVTIGRVEVRAAAPAPTPKDQRAREPRLNLEDYLRRREKA